MNRPRGDLMMRGMPREAIEQNVKALASGADLEAAGNSNSSSSSKRSQTDQEVDVDEAELNGRIAILAAQRGDARKS